MSNAPQYWAKAKKILSKRDKVMRKLISSYKDGNLVTRNDVFFSLCKSIICLLYTSPSPRDVEESRMPSSA